jgi:hypothetical protein
MKSLIESAASSVEMPGCLNRLWMFEKSPASLIEMVTLSRMFEPAYKTAISILCLNVREMGVAELD